MFAREFESIIVGVDFSPYSKIVYKQAKNLAKFWRTQLIVAHATQATGVYVPMFFFPIQPPPTDAEYKKRIKKFYQIKDDKVTIAIGHGSPADLMIELCEKYRYAMIVSGYKGAGPIAEFFFGSTAQKLIHKSKVPVWIHRGNKIVIPKRVLIPHDLSSEANQGIDLFKRLSLKQPTEYEVMFVREKPFPVLDYNLYKITERQMLLREQNGIRYLFAKYPRIPFFTTSGSVTEKLVKRTKNFDLILITHHNEGQLFPKNETIGLLKKANTPLLVV